MRTNGSEQQRRQTAPAPGAPSPALIDVDHLARQTLFDVNLRRQILGLFKVDATARLATLSATEDPAVWRLAAHSIKGAARTIGAFPCAAIAERLEKSEWPLNADLRQQLIASMSSAVDDIIGRIDELQRNEPGDAPAG